MTTQDPRWKKYEDQPANFMPDNRQAFLYDPDNEEDAIVIGATNKHTFALDFKFSEHCTDINVIYRQSLETIMIKSKVQLTIDETQYPGKTYVFAVITPEDSKTFVDYRECYAQLKIQMNDGSILYGAMNRVRVYGTTESDIILSSNEVFYSNLLKKNEYLYEYTYDTLDYNLAYDYFKTNEYAPNFIGGSALRYGDFIGRNYDSEYNRQAEFIIRTQATTDRFASIGIAIHPNITSKYLENKEFEEEDIKTLPFMLTDGINEYGVYAEACYVAKNNNINYTISTTPTRELKLDINAAMVVRYVLDNFTSALTAADFLAKYARISSTKAMLDAGYDLHWIIADPEDTYIVEMDMDGTIKKTHKKLCDMQTTSTAVVRPVMTTFYSLLTTRKADDTIYTPAYPPATGNVSTANTMSANSTGLERYNLLWRDLSAQYAATNSSTTKDSMAAWLQTELSKAYFSHAYPPRITTGAEKWYSEYAGDKVIPAGSTTEITVSIDTPTATIDLLSQKWTDEYNGRNRSTGTTKHTVHSCIYDTIDKKLLVRTQENDDTTYEFTL